MNSRSSSQHLWARILLIYLVVAGSVPFLSSILASASLHGVNTRRNFEIAWGLMNMVPACAGVGLALRYTTALPIFSGVAVVCLTIEILFPLLDYRRIGFDPRMNIGLTMPEYLAGMIAIGVPFVILFLIFRRKQRREYSYSR